MKRSFLRPWACAVALLAVAVHTSTAASRLQLLGQAVIAPADGKGPGAEQVAFDDGQKIAYLVGGDKLFVVDLSANALLPSGGALAPAGPPKNLSVLQTVTLPATANDVNFCATRAGGYLAISANSAVSKVLPGSVTIFNRYLRAGGAASLEQLAQFTVGAVPDQLEFSRDCRTILVSNEGEPITYSPASLANDPEGSVSVINLNFCDDHPGGDAYPYAAAEEEQDSDAPDRRGVQAGPTGVKILPRDHGYEPHSDYKPHHYKHTQHNDYEPRHNDYEPRHSDYGYSHPDGALECQGGGGVWGRVRTARFTAWNNKKTHLESQGVKLTGVNATVAQDLEPEYSTFSADERIAFVCLQENNAIAVLDVERAIITSIHALGFKDHNTDANPLDPSDKDGPAALIGKWPVFGMFMPDEIRSFRHRGADYVVTANEGDARADWPGLSEETQAGHTAVKDNVNTTVFPNSTVFADANIGRLRVLTINGKPYDPFSDPDNTDEFQKLFSFGARSFSIWRLEQPHSHKGPVANATLTRVFDSGAQLEQISRDQLIDIWNSELGNVDNSSFDQRSDNKGPEPEGLAIGPCVGGGSARPYGYYSTGAGHDERLCLFLGTERLGVMFVWDISDPTKPVFQSFSRPPVNPEDGKPLSAPEGVAYARYTLGAQSLSVVLVAYEADSDKPELPGGLGVYLVTDA